ncbi:MAG: 30S ribosomal protein S12 methylthiotransferase RimO [Treponema sp.]|nr:30S ribosomal protein S12 methylthiotransferase RimO [Treponema sp.]
MAHYFLDPFGCAKNQVDAETIMALLGKAGWSATENPAEADLIIVNSCAFIESAKRESLNAVFAWRKQYPGTKILLAGCLAQRYAAELSLSLPEADGLFGNTSLEGIAAAAAALVPDSTSGGESPPSLQTCTSFGLPLPPPPGGSAPKPPQALPGTRPLLSPPGSAYLKISEGCNNRCSFCAIPLIRGPLRSRDITGISAECRTLLDRGIRELCVIGQDIASFGDDRPDQGDLPALLEAIAAIPGHFWVRLLYLHPDRLPLSILDIMAADRRFLPYFDIPLQHASRPLLQAMNRRGDGEHYLDLIQKIRTTLPDAVIRSTFLVGFPGESEDDFAQLLDFQEQAALDWAGCFTYSREENTPAYPMKNQVPRSLAAKRKRMLEERQQGISEGRMERFVGRELEVLIEERFTNPEEGAGGLYLGRAYCQAPDVDGVSLVHSETELIPGALIRCRVNGRAGFDLRLQPTAKADG